MFNYKVVIQYDGTRYQGWQSQGTLENTIQGRIEAVLSQMVGYSVKIYGSGRTDAGVHAKGQTANFHLEDEKNPEAICDYLNRYLPKDIGILSAEAVDERFHSRYHAKEKTYLYRIHTGRMSNVFERKYVYNYEQPLLTERMRRAAAYAIGTHDFKSFCGNKKTKKSTVREIFEIRIEESENEIQIFYTGNGFLQNMVRILTGTLIEIGDGRREPEEFLEIMEAKNRAAAGYTAPACGLVLLEVRY